MFDNKDFRKELVRKKIIGALLSKSVCEAEQRIAALRENEMHTQTHQRGPDSSKVNICAINVVSHLMEAVEQRCGFVPDGEHRCHRLNSNQKPTC